MKNQRGVSAFLEVFIALAVLTFVGFVIYRAVTVKPVADNSTTTETVAKEEPKEVEVDEKLFTLTLPAGWEKKSAGPKDSLCTHAQTSEHYYGDGDGNFFDVCVDPGGRGYSSDYNWETKLTGSSLELTAEEGCTKGEVFCDLGNGNLFIGIKINQGNPVKGHYYFMEAGNTNTEGQSSQVYKDILASFRVK